MTRHEANQQAIHYGCGGRLQVAQKPGGGTIWIVGVRCRKCGKKVIERGAYRRWFHGEEAMADRRQQAIAEFNRGAPWEQED